MGSRNGYARSLLVGGKTACQRQAFSRGEVKKSKKETRLKEPGFLIIDFILLTLWSMILYLIEINFLFKILSPDFNLIT